MRHRPFFARTLFAALVGAAVLGNARPAEADVWGCSLTQGPTHLRDCLEGKKNDVVNDANRRLAEAQRKIEDAEKRVREARDEARRELDKQGTLARIQGETDLLRAARTMAIEPLLHCLGSSAARARTDFAHSASRFAGDPTAFVRAAYDDAFGLVAQDARDLVGDVSRLDQPPRRPTSDEVVDAVWNRMEKISQRHEALRCLVDYLRPRLPAIKRAIGEALVKLETMAAAAWNDHVKPIVFTLAAKALGAALDKIVNKDGSLVMQGALAENMLNPPRVHQDAEKLHLLATALQRGSGVQAQLADTRQALANRFHITPDLYIDMAFAGLKSIGHRNIDSDRAPGALPPGGGWIIDQGLAKLDWLPTVGNGVINSACGLIPEGGTAGCVAFITSALSFVWSDVVRPGIKMTTLAALDWGFDKGMDFLKAKLKAHVSAPLDAGATQLKRDAGAFGEMADRFQVNLVRGFVDGYVNDTRDALDHYNRSVIELANAAAAGKP